MAVEDFLGELEGLVERQDVAAILRGIATHSSHCRVAQQGCRALMTVLDKGESPAVQQHAVGDVMSLTINKANIQGDVRNLSVNIADCTINNADIQVAIAQLGGIEAVLEVCARHPDDTEVQINAVGALWLIASRNANNKMAIAQLGGIKAVLKTLVLHPTAALVHQQALRALASLSANNANNKMAIAQLGGIEAVLEARARHQDDAAVQQQAMVVLRNITTNNAENQVRSRSSAASRPCSRSALATRTTRWCSNKRWRR